MKTIKRICMTLIIMMLSIAVVFGATSMTSFALSAGQADTLVEKINVVSTVKYGNSFDVPTVSGKTVKVTAPDGKAVSVVDGKVLAEQVGTYTVTYTFDADGSVGYDFDVYSYVDKDYSINVSHGGADIPTIAKKGKKITLPEASLVWYDEDGVQQKSDAKVFVRTTMGGTDVAADGKQEIEFTQTGNVYVTYYAQLDENGDKYYTKNFTVKVQDTFTDDQNPTVGAVNVPRDATLNKKITLPVATGSDTIDENVKVVVSVEFDGKPVKKAVVDKKTGFATGKTEEDEVFDNDKNMSFYPTEKGTYMAYYQAFDDEGNKSGRHEYKIEVSDTSAPVFDKIDDWQIPAAWGLTVTGKKDTNPKSTFKFPKPEMSDNCGNEGITVALRVTDPKGNTVISIKNILAEGEDATYKGSASTYGGADATFTIEDEFDFGKVLTGEKTGDFKVEYTAKDSNNNRSTKTYTVKVSDTFEDADDPSAASIIDSPKYIVVDSDTETFEVPGIEASDAADSRPHIEYTLTSAADTDKSIAVEGGDVIEIEQENGIVFKKGDETLTVAGGKKALKLTLKVTDKVGNSKEEFKEIDVVSSEVANDKLALATDDLTLSGPFKTNALAELGSFDITVGDAPVGDVKNDEYRDFTGYELSLKNPDGDYVKLSSEYYYNTENNHMVVRNINFVPEKVGEYQLNIRAFDLSGQSIVAVALIDVAEGDKDDNETTSAVLPSTGKINVEYTFRNTSLKLNGLTGTYFMVHKVEGGKHAVMGSQITAMNASSYYIVDGYAKYEAGTVGKLETAVAGGGYDVTFTGDEDPIVEVLGIMPTYKEKDETVELPKIVAYNANGNGSVSVSVQRTTQNGSGSGSVTTKLNDAGQYEFKADADGEYTIRVTGTVGGKSTTVEYKMSAGDVVGPEFTIDKAFSANVSVGTKFTFAAVSATAGEGESLSDFTYTKRLIDPSGQEVTEATVSGKGSTYANKVQKDSNTDVLLSKSGTYQIVYEVTDAVGNSTKQTYTVTVTGKTGTSPMSIAAISTVLIVVGVVLIAAVILYFVLFRKRKVKGDTK